MSIKMPKCNSCHNIIAPDELSVKFKCPNCGQVEIWRCEKCRVFSNKYRCPKCGFEGP